MALTPREVITIDIEANPKKAISEIAKLTSSISDNMKKNQKAADKMGKGFQHLWKQFGNSKDKVAGLKKLNAQLKEIEKGLGDIGSKKSTLEEMVKTARSLKRGSAERKTAMTAAGDYKKMYGLAPKKYKQTVKGLEGAHKDVKSSKEEFEDAADFDWEEAGETFAEPFRDMLSRDAPTIMKRIMKTLTVPKVVGDWGKKVGERGSERMKGADAWGGGAKGLGNKMLGGAEKAIGGLAKGMAMLGPILTAAGGFMMGFIKILLDAEAAAKEYNKQLLETTSTAGFLSRNFGNAEIATRDLQNSLKAARDGAINLGNAQMGISKEVARSFQAAITAEGVALDRLGKSTATATVSAEQHTKTIQMGVAFSRQFGVSLSEIAQTQGQLMADVGMSGEQVTASFQRIADGADSAGMEANKFFGVVRSFSSDLSLFTLRMEDVTKIMGTLGKTMDPRKMDKFLHELNQKFGGGIVDNLKFEMMAEKGGGREVMEKDLASKFKNLGRDITAAVGSEDEAKAVEKMIKENDERGIAAWSAKNKGKVGGPVVDAITQLMTQNKRLASGDRLDAASVMENLSPLSKMEMLQAATKSMFGKKMEDLSGIELAAAENAGIASAKEIQMYKQFHQGLLQGQEELLDHLASGLLTDDDKQQLVRLGADPDEVGKAAADALREKFEGADGDRVFYDSLDKSQQELIKSAVKTRDFQAESADLQVSILDKVGLIADILMNEIYKVLEWIGSLFGKGRDRGKEQAKSEVIALQSKDAGLRKDWTSGEGNLTKSKTAVIEKSGRRAIEGLQNAAKEAQGIQAQLTKAKGPQEKAKLEKRLGELKPALELQKKYGTDVKAFQTKLYKIAESEALGGVPEVMKVVEEALKAGVSGDGGMSTASGQTANPAAAAAASVGPSVSQAPARSAAAAEEAVTQQKATVSAVTELARTAANDGIKLSPTTVSGPLSDAMAKSVYEGAAKALFEFYMYSGLDRTQVVNAMQNGMDGKGVASTVMGGAAQGLNPAAALAGAVVQPNAMGGTVSSIMNGMATIQRPAPGEGWASVGPGEQIVPAGGGGGGGGTTKVQLELKGDLRRLIDARVVEGAAAHDRNKRHR